jgi:hypothetical protein
VALPVTDPFHWVAGTRPTRRHLPSCSHVTHGGDQARRATPKEMAALVVCQSCAARPVTESADAPTLCQRCFTIPTANGTCNCE